MKNNYFFSIRFYLTICFISSLFFNSCGKKGCSDKAALNYESGITKDDGTCTYNADKLIGTVRSLQGRDQPQSAGVDHGSRL